MWVCLRNCWSTDSGGPYSPHTFRRCCSAQYAEAARFRTLYTLHRLSCLLLYSSLLSKKGSFLPAEAQELLWISCCSMDPPSTSEIVLLFLLMFALFCLLIQKLSAECPFLILHPLLSVSRLYCRDYFAQDAKNFSLTHQMNRRKVD